MKRSTARILTTHAGRLPNPDNIAAIQQARTDGDQATFDRLVKAAVAVDVVAEFRLLAHSVSDASLDEPVKRCLVAVGAGLHDRSDIVGIRQPPGVRREDPFRATLHNSPPVVLGLPKQLMTKHCDV